MGFRKPFGAVPVKLAPHYRRKEALHQGNRALRYLSTAAIARIGLGVGSVALPKNGSERIAATVKPLAVAAGVARARAPQTGDYWPKCDSARAAGTAPIYSGEPGYREDLDADSGGGSIGF